MPHERTPVGTVVYTVRAQVLGLKKSFFGSSTMEDEASLKFVTIPSRDEGGQFTLPMSDRSGSRRVD